MIEKEAYPAILNSFVYLKGFLKSRNTAYYRNWMLDSGAYTAWTKGIHIDLAEYIAVCKKLRAEDPTLDEIIALDVIGSDKGSLKNSLDMKAAGVEAMPVFHIGDDWGILKEYAAGWDKVGLSCRFGEKHKESLKFYGQCFSKVWPKKFHSFGWISEQMLMTYPFHSGDSSTWVTSGSFGRWQEFGVMSCRKPKLSFRSQVEWYLKLEARVRQKWQGLFVPLGWKLPEVRLAVSNFGLIKNCYISGERTSE